MELSSSYDEAQEGLVKGMNREILRIALPNVISNITVPLMGLASTAIAGYSGEDSAYAIGQLAVGVSIFNMIYHNCNFVRMGTSGLTAQAFGAGNNAEITRMLIRALSLALLIGVLLLLFRSPLASGAVSLVGGGELAHEYVLTRFWALPAGIMLFGLYGWFTGMQSGVDSMATAIVVNILHLSCSIYFVLIREVGVVGLAYASIIAQWSGVVVALSIILFRYRRVLVPVSFGEVMDRSSVWRLFSVNANIVVRTLCNVAVYTYFTRFSSQMADDRLLAVNAILMQLFILYSYMNDGFSSAVEALTGRFIGARDSGSLRRAVGRTIVWSLLWAILYMAVYSLSWRDILSALAGGGDNGSLVELAGEYIGWGIVLPLLGAIPILMDGVMVGSGLTRVMRDSMIVATIIYFSTHSLFASSMGNDALWLAFSLFIVARGVLPYLFTHRMKSVVDLAS